MMLHVRIARAAREKGSEHRACLTTGTKWVTANDEERQPNGSFLEFLHGCSVGAVGSNPEPGEILGESHGKSS